MIWQLVKSFVMLKIGEAGIGSTPLLCIWVMTLGMIMMGLYGDKSHDLILDEHA